MKKISQNASKVDPRWSPRAPQPPKTSQNAAKMVPKTEPKSSFSRGSRPGPTAGIPAPLEHGHRPHGTRFRVLLGATLLPDGCPVGVRRQVWTAQGGLKPPCIVTLSMLQPRIVTMRDCTSARSRVSGRVGSGHAARVNLGLLSRRSCQ